jgi:Fic family protein
MPLIVPEKELLEILGIIRGFSGSISVSELHNRLETPRRTLQRRLERLVQEGRLSTSGGGRSRRYHLPDNIDASYGISVEDHAYRREIREDSAPFILSGDNQQEVDDDDHTTMTISQGGREVRDLVQRPLHLRDAVNYNPEFLISYQPNITHYLSPEICGQLAEKGVGSGVDLPAGTYLRKVMDRLLIDLSWNSSRLEGNTYSLLETERLLDTGEDDTGKSAWDKLMILNHKTAIEMLAEQSDEVGFNRYTILNLHAALSEDLLKDENACGRLRDEPIGISGTKYRPLNVPQQIEDYFDVFLGKVEAIVDPFEQAFFAMVHLPYLQPFQDVNKRTSRLAANIPLVRHNLSPLSFIGVPQKDYIGGLLAVYELNRVDYLRDVFIGAYEKSCAHYAAVCQQVEAPDPLRLHHRRLIKQCKVTVVRQGMDKQTAANWIARQAETQVAAGERALFCEAVEDGLRKLHEGSIARHRIRPSEYHAWKTTWR